MVMGLLGKTLQLVAVVLTLLLAMHEAPAAAGGESGGGGGGGTVRPRRLIHLFDFEEQAQGNWEKMPRYWFVIGRDPQIADPNFHRQLLHQQLISRPGFPSYTEVGFARDFATSGKTSFHLGLNGGSAGAFLQVGSIVAVPQSDYLITANLRTAQLQRAKARLTAYFVDERGRRIEGSVSQTQLISTKEKWVSISAKLQGDYPEAAWVGMEVQLLQPEPLADNPLGRHQIVLQDVRGQAWFDDIGVWQLPHVEVATQSPINIIRAPQIPQLTINVRDLTGQRLEAQLTIYDHTLRPIAQQSRIVGSGQPNQWVWAPPLKKFGWYLLDMVVREQTNDRAGPVARTIGAMLWLDKKSNIAGSDARRFALLAEEISDEELTLLPELVRSTTGQVAIISAWEKTTTLENLSKRQRRLDELISSIRSGGGEVMLSIGTIPAELAQSQGVNATEPLRVLQTQPDKWLPYLAPVLTRLGQQVHYWQLGRADEPDAFFYPNLPDILTDIERRFRALAPRPQLVVPWRIDQSRRRDVFQYRDITYLIQVPPSVTPTHLGAHLEAWRSPPADFWLYLRQAPADQMAHTERVIDLALDMIHGWEAQPSGMAISRPWTKADQRRSAVAPDPLLGVFSNVAGHLANRRVLGRLSLGSGLDCMILDTSAGKTGGKSGKTGGGGAGGTGGGGMLIAWNTQAPRSNAVIDMYLGQAPVAIDVWGNRAAIALVDGKHRLQLTDAPIFIAGIDPQLALFRAHFAVKPSYIESDQGQHQRTITLRNPWARTITGHMQITGPEEWSISPARQFFSIASGQSITLPVTMSFPISEAAGDKMFRANFQFMADQPYDVDMVTPLRLGMEDIDFVATLALEPGALDGTTDVIMAAVITNTSDKPTSLYVFANLRGHKRQERPVSRLEPGQSVVTRFRFEDAGDAIASYPLRTGVRATNGPAILNYRMTIEDAQ